jgi:hypothetical protein
MEGLPFGEAIATTGNAGALLQLRDQVDRALRNDSDHPFEKGVYQGTNGIPLEVVVKEAKR